ncbi:MAG: methyltransferase domain-containing protein [Solirubrobacterales bacterium]|nr:methyltransferase domain-containing protein [Solirubrobacterales bacterium]MBV9714343.1 methyltransferase domain-containing protein [Solirubrobacterales bacterium]
MDPSLELNRANWDERAPAHATSPGYGLKRFFADPSFISEIVRFDVPRLGDVTGLRGVHLQCHIGSDTVSLARLGADMTGLDFSPAALAEARQLASGAGVSVEFVEAEVYAALDVLAGASFDFVFTGMGALCWLPKIAPWAEVVAALLRPGGFLFMREAHPMLWAISDRDEALLAVEYAYFEIEEPLVWDDPGTYVETEHTFANSVTHEWNHGLGEIVTALLNGGMELQMLIEHDSVPWEALPGRMERISEKEWRLRDRPWRLPHSYTLRAAKRTDRPSSSTTTFGAGAANRRLEP